MPTQPVSGRARDSCNVVDATASRRDGNLSPGRPRPECIQLPVDLGLHINKRVGDEVLVDVVDLHDLS